MLRKTEQTNKIQNLYSLLFDTAAMQNQGFFKKRIQTRLQSAAVHLSVNMCNQNVIK
jgi:hypothetical protein